MVEIDSAAVRGPETEPRSQQSPWTDTVPVHLLKWSFLLLGSYLIQRFLPLAALCENGWAVWWPTNGIALTLLLRSKRRAWPGILSAVTLGTLIAERSSNDTATEMAWVALCNATEVLIPALFLPRFDNLSVWLQKPRLMWKFVLFALLLGPAVSSLMSAFYYHLSFYHRPFWEMFQKWGVSDMVGIVMFAPLVMVLISPETWSLFRIRELPMTLGSILLLVSGAWWVFTQTKYPIAFVLFPVILLVAIRTGFSGSVIAINLLAPIVTSATLHGMGPFAVTADAGGPYHIIMVQIFLILAMLTAFPISVARVRQQSTASQLQAAYLQMEALATADGLTGLANRRRFDTALEAEWRRALRDSRPVGLLMLDVDNFKAYNDSHGHQAGDACLQAIARAICEIPERSGDMVARYGGEEFVVLLPGTDGHGAHSLAELVRTNVETLRIPHKQNVTGLVTVSIGCTSIVPDEQTRVNALIEQSDRALYMAKQHGRNLSILYESSFSSDRGQSSSADRLSNLIQSELQ